MIKDRVKIFIVDDHPIVSEGLEKIFSRERGYEVCGTAGNIDEAVYRINSLNPQLLISDINFEGINSGIDFIKEMKNRYPGLKILVISMHEEDIYAERTAKAGASGYLMKSELTGKIISAVEEIMNGGVFFNPSILAKMVGALKGDGNKGESITEKFTDRELQIFELLAQGNSGKRIADELHISPKTVDTYKNRLRIKLNLETNSDLIKYAIRWLQDGGKRSE